MAKNPYPVSKPKCAISATWREDIWEIQITINGQTVTADLPYWIPAWEVVISDPGTIQ